MSTTTPSEFRLAGGVDAFNPPVAKDELKFYRLENVDGRLGRLLSAWGFTSLQTNIGLVISFGFYQLSNRQYFNLYAFTATSIYRFDFSTGLFNSTPIYTGFNSSTEPYVMLPWFDCLYVSRLGDISVKIEYATVTQVTTIPPARYGIICNNHVLLAGVADSSTRMLARVQWSDLDAPESFDIDPNESEADFFDLEAESRECTGVSYQRGNAIIYTHNVIWVASAVGFPGGFRLDPLYTGVGNIFHGAVARVKESDYFIGDDSFYELNGFQLIPIGKEMFDRFIGDITISSTTRVQAIVNSRTNQVIWLYLSASRGFLWAVVYNYQDKTWSERHGDEIAGWLDTPRAPMKGYAVINSVSTLIDNVSTLIDDPNYLSYPVTLAPLAGHNYSAEDPDEALVQRVTQASYTAKKRHGGYAFEQLIETFDFYFADFGNVNEVTKVNIEYTGAGSPAPVIYVGTRKNQSEDITWSSSVAVSNNDGTLCFYIRDLGVARYLRFRIAWGNTATNYITDLRLISFTKVKNSDDGDAIK